MDNDRAIPYHHGNLRQELLAQAGRALQEGALEELSLRRLARASGVSEAAPRRHFRDRAALLDALALSGFESLTAAFAACPTVGILDVDTSALARAFFRFAIGNPALLDLMFSRKHRDATIASAARRSFSVPVAVIHAAQERGEIAGGDPATAGVALFAAIQGIATFTRSGVVAADDTDRILEETLRIVISGLRAAAPRSQ